MLNRRSFIKCAAAILALPILRHLPKPQWVRCYEIKMHFERQADGTLRGDPQMTMSEVMICEGDVEDVQCAWMDGRKANRVETIDITRPSRSWEI